MSTEARVSVVWNLKKNHYSRIY